VSHALGPEELMRFLDDELPADRRAAVEAHLEECTECRRDYVVFSKMKGELRSMAMENGTGPSLWDTLGRQLVRPTGWLLVIVGALALAAWGVYSYVRSPEDLWTKLATGALVIGFVLLLLSAILDRVKDLRTDRYREVER